MTRVIERKTVDAPSTNAIAEIKLDLNKVWADLFVRLAPDEPYVPAFCEPKDTWVVTPSWRPDVATARSPDPLRPCSAQAT